MSLEKKLRELGTRNIIGLASGPWSKNYDKIIEIWRETGIGYIILKTMMDSEDYRVVHFKMKPQIIDQNMTIFHKENTSKEQLNFYDNPDKIISLINKLYNEGVAIIPNIGTKKTNELAWENMKKVLDKTPTKVIEINLRYTYRGLASKYEIAHRGSNNLWDEYFIDEPSNKNWVDNDFKKLLGMIREIFPPNEYALIGKLWGGDPELGTHLNYLSENCFDAVTLVNSKKVPPPNLSEVVKQGKLPQMSGYRLRADRDFALYKAKTMNYGLPIFASGSVAVEAAKEHEDLWKEHCLNKSIEDAQKDIEDAAQDIKRCTELGATYVQLGSVIILGRIEAVRNIMRKVGSEYIFSPYSTLKKVA